MSLPKVLCRNETTLRKDFLAGLESSLATVHTDKRDEWPTNLTNDYQRGSCLESGQFGIVVAAQARDCGGYVSSTPRTCVMKVQYLGKKVDKIFEDVNGNLKEVEKRLDQLAKKVVLEVYLMNRVRHSNIIHSHFVSVVRGDLTFILPKLYNLENIIVQYRKKMNGESVPAEIILRVIRQICIGLTFLEKCGIVHRTIHAENVYLTRGGTIKIGHFGSIYLEGYSQRCVTPVGKREYMCYEKQFNLCVAETRDSCISYGSSSDVWALGILVLRMVSYYPNEKWQRLHSDFAFTMHQEGMPFKWIIGDLTQLRVRLRKAAGDYDLRGWLSDKVLTVDPQRRATASELLKSETLKAFCCEKLKDDKDYLVRTLIEVLDWPNRERIETNRPNYDSLESKDIPAEFYWDDGQTWKDLERAEFSFDITVKEEDRGEEKKRRNSVMGGSFIFRDAHKLLQILTGFVEEDQLNWLDILPIDHHIKENSFNAMRNHQCNRIVKCTESSFSLPNSLHFTNRDCNVNVKIVAFTD